MHLHTSMCVLLVHNRYQRVDPLKGKVVISFFMMAFFDFNRLMPGGNKKGHTYLNKPSFKCVRPFCYHQALKVSRHGINFDPQESRRAATFHFDSTWFTAIQEKLRFLFSTRPYGKNSVKH